MGNDQLAARLGPSGIEAVRLLLHHVHGGLHNAAMALELAGERADGRVAADDARLVAQSGLEGIASAARGVSLLTVMFGLSHGPGNAPADRRWIELVESFLRPRAAERDVEVDIAPGLAAPQGDMLDAEQLVAALLDGIAAIDEAAPGARLALPRAAPPRPTGPARPSGSPRASR